RPTVDDVHNLLDQMLVVNVSPLNKTLATVKCTSSDPRLCRDVLLSVDSAAQSRLDNISVQSAQHISTYLNSVLTTTNEVSVREALISMMANAEVQAVISNGVQPRAVVLDSPEIPSRPSFPKPSLL